MSIKQKAIEWLVLILAVFVAANIVPGLGYLNLQSLVVAALVLSLLNTFIKPMFLLLSLPFIVLTMGLFLIIINTLLLMLTAVLVKGFYVEGFWNALGGAIVISIISSLLSFSVSKKTTSTPPPSSNSPRIDKKDDDVIDI
jgi:putative membrane protein